MSETVAWATPIYEAVKPVTWRALQRLGFRMARTIENLWLLDIPDRLTYPFSHRAIVESLEQREKQDGRRADWLFIIEDDIVPATDLYDVLRAAVDPVNKPYVSALAYCRTEPYWPGAADVIPTNGRFGVRQWESAPQSGTLPVDQVSMCAALFHRSLFDRVAKPWFGTGDIGPDAFWCKRLKMHGIQPYMCCDAEVGHLATGTIINRKRSEAWNAAKS